jgi:pimeloyl-ACP methyl ester carboxylesterase
MNRSSGGELTCRKLHGAGLHLQVTEYGDPARPSVVLVHGFPDTSATWKPVADLLSDDFHVVAYDVRGAGASDAPHHTEDYSLSLLVEDMSAVIAAVSPDAPVHLVGHDWGSIQGWEAVISDRLTGRIASYTSISGPPIDHAGLWARKHLTLKPDDVRAALGQAARSWYIALFQLPFLPELVTRLVRLQRVLSDGARWRRGTSLHAPSPRSTTGDDFAHGLQLYRANVSRRFRHPTAGHTQTPVQVIVPTNDRYISPALLEGLETWTSVLWRRQVDAGHWIIHTHPDDIARWVRQVITFVESGLEPEDLARWRVPSAP